MAEKRLIDANELEEKAIYITGPKGSACHAVPLGLIQAAPTIDPETLLKQARAIRADAELAHIGATYRVCRANTARIAANRPPALRGTADDGGHRPRLPSADECNADANIIWGASFDAELEDEMRITVIATGFTKESAAKESAAPAKQEAPAAAPAACPDAETTTAPVPQERTPEPEYVSELGEEPEADDAILGLYSSTMEAIRQGR